MAEDISGAPAARHNSVSLEDMKKGNFETSTHLENISTDTSNHEGGLEFGSEPLTEKS